MNFNQSAGRIGKFCFIVTGDARMCNTEEAGTSKGTFLLIPDVLFRVKRNPLSLSIEFDTLSQAWIRVYRCEEEPELTARRIREELTFLSRICTSASPCYSSLFPPIQKGRGVVRNIHEPVERKNDLHFYSIPLVLDYNYVLLLQLTEAIEQQCGVISPEKEFLGPDGFGQLELQS